MSAEPEDDMRDGPPTPRELALWVLFGTDTMRWIPPTFKEIVKRIERVIAEERKKK